MASNAESFRKHEVPGRVAVATGNGGLVKLVVTSASATAEIYPHGAHITAFQKNGEPPLIFMGGKSDFEDNKAIRGGVPICYPWFGPREGSVVHGFARITEWAGAGHHVYVYFNNDGAANAVRNARALKALLGQ